MREAVDAVASLIADASLVDFSAGSVLGQVEPALASHASVIIEGLAVGNIALPVLELEGFKALLTSVVIHLLLASQQNIMKAFPQYKC